MGREQLERRLVWLPFALRTQPRIAGAPVLELRGGRAKGSRKHRQGELYECKTTECHANYFRPTLETFVRICNRDFRLVASERYEQTEWRGEVESGRSSRDTPLIKSGSYQNFLTSATDKLCLLPPGVAPLQNG
jgi:hypothetical protein